MRTPKQPAVYILASAKDGTTYTGVTSDLIARIWQHKNNVSPGFAQNHNCKILVWYELHETMTSAITREKQIKAGSRMAKGILISKTNPNWTDLYDEILYDGLLRYARNDTQNHHAPPAPAPPKPSSLRAKRSNPSSPAKTTCRRHNLPASRNV